MIIYNITVNIEEAIHNDWFSWMKETHIPEVMRTGFFSEYRMAKVITTQDDEVGQTYAIQYSCDSLKDLNEYQEKHAPKLQEDHLNRYKDKFVAFRTLLEVV